MAWRDIIALNVAAFTALGFVSALWWAKPPVARPLSKMDSPTAPVKSAVNVENTKRVAFSFDDVPRGHGAFFTLDQRPQMLIAKLREGGVKQAAFFVNPGQSTVTDPAKDPIMKYARAGHAIANHTSHHVIARQTSAEAFLADVDDATARIKAMPNYRPWFRFPALDEGGRDKVKRDAIRAGLKQRELKNGYATVDGWDWFLDTRAREAAQAGKLLDYNELRRLFVETYVESAEFSDRLAMRVLGRHPVQMLLLHETDTAALYIADLARALKAKGWTIVTADEAYADPMAKLTPDIEVTEGTMLEMLATERKISGDRWFPRNDAKIARALFTARVLGEPEVIASGTR